jgi:hypothetical protein
MVDKFPGEPPRTVVTQPYPANRAPTSAQISGSGGTLVVNADGSLNTVAELPSTATLTNIVINAVANGDNTLVTGTASKTIKVYQLVLGPASAAVNGIFKTGTASAISGTMVLSTTQALVLDFSPYPWLLTHTADSLILNLSTTASVGGFASVLQS